MSAPRGWTARRMAGKPMPNEKRDTQIRFLRDNSEMSLVEIGRMYGITKQRVHQICRKAA